MSVKRIAATILILSALAPVGGGAAPRPSPIVVIVSKDNPMDSISLEDLRRLYLGTTVELPSRDRAILLETAALRDRFYTSVLRMSGSSFKRHWIGVVFSGESSTPPKGLGTTSELLQFVGEHRGAIAFLDAGSVTSAVKILRVDGLHHEEPSYPLR